MRADKVLENICIFILSLVGVDNCEAPMAHKLNLPNVTSNKGGRIPQTKNIRMTTKQIGRITVFKISVFSVLVIFLLPIVSGLILKLSDDDISISTFYENLIGDTVINIPFLIIQTVVLAFGIWTIGAKAGESILTNNQGKFKTGFLTIFSLWGLLFISSTLTTGLMNSIKYGATGFLSGVTDWFVYGFFLYLFLGLIHALTIGYLIGKKIFLLGQKNNFVSADT